MGRITVPGFQSVVQPGSMPTPQMPGVGGDPTMTARLAGQAIEQGQQISRGMAELGEAGLQIATDMQREANRVQVIRGQNDAQRAIQELSFGVQGSDEPGFQSFKGQAALGDLNGADLSASYADKLKQRLDEVSASFGNDAQRSAFAVWRGTAEADFAGRVRSHQQREFESLKRSTYQGAIEIGINNAAADWQNDGKVREAIDGTLVPGSDDERYGGVRQAAYELGKAQGKSALEIEYDVRKAVSSAHVGVLAQALANGDSRRAIEYLQAHKGDMLETDVLKADGQVREFVDTASSQTAVSAAVKAMANRFQPTDMDKLTGIVLGLESGGRDTDAQGNPLTSRAGAKYAMQVMPETAKAPGFGIRPAADDGAAEYNRVGRELLGALVKKYGNVGQALAAYNGGSKDVDRAVEAARKAGDPDNWVQHLRDFKSPEAFAENSAYVKNGLARLAAGDGAPARPTLQDFTQAAVAQLGPNPSPQALKLTQQGAEHQYGVIEKALKAQDDQAVADAMRALQANGGRVDLLPIALRSRVPPKELDNLYGYADRIAKGDDRTSEWLYAKLAGNPQQLAGMSDDQFYALRKELSEGDFKHFANERAKAQGKALPDAGKAGDLNSSAIKNTLDTRLRTLGIDPTPKDDGGKDAARVGAIRQFVDQYFTAAQKEAGKKFSDAEVATHIDALFAQNATFKGWFSNSSKPLLSMKNPGDMPTADRENILSAFKRAGNDAPTDAQVLGAYWNLELARRSAKAAPKSQALSPAFFDFARSLLEPK